jgi:hypothetical protein
MRMPERNNKRNEDIKSGKFHTATLSVMVWDIAKLSWQARLLYIEYCTWGGAAKIDLTTRQLSRKISRTLGKGQKMSIAAVSRAKNELKKRGLIRINRINGWKDEVTLLDFRMNWDHKWFKMETSRMRIYFYHDLEKETKEAKEREDDN